MSPTRLVAVALTGFLFCHYLGWQFGLMAAAAVALLFL